MDTPSRKETDRNNYPPVTGIGRDEHVGMVREIFTTIPGRYDFLNRLLSLRRDVAWRRFAVRKMRFFGTFRLTRRGDRHGGSGHRSRPKASGDPGDRDRLHPRRCSPRDGKESHCAALPDASGFSRRTRWRFVPPTGVLTPWGSPSASGTSRTASPPLREMRRVLVPGGRVYVLEMNAPGTGSGVGFRPLSEPRPSRHRAPLFAEPRRLPLPGRLHHPFPRRRRPSSR